MCLHPAKQLLLLTTAVDGNSLLSGHAIPHNQLLEATLSSCVLSCHVNSMHRIASLAAAGSIKSDMEMAELPRSTNTLPQPSSGSLLGRPPLLSSMPSVKRHSDVTQAASSLTRPVMLCNVPSLKKTTQGSDSASFMAGNTPLELIDHRSSQSALSAASSHYQEQSNQVLGAVMLVWSACYHHGAPTCHRKRRGAVCMHSLLSHCCLWIYIPSTWSIYAMQENKMGLTYQLYLPTLTTPAAAASAAGLTAAPGLSGRHSLKSLPQPVLSDPKTSLHMVHNVQKKYAVSARQGNMTRDSLAHISMNLPEAPAALRHMPVGQSLSYHQQRQTDRHNSYSEPSAFAPGSVDFSHSTTLRRQQSTANAAVTVSLPESPKKAMLRKQSAGKTSVSQLPDGSQLHGNPGAAGASAPCSVSNAETVGLFGNASLNDGPPRLAYPSLSTSSSVQDVAEARPYSDSTQAAPINVTACTAQAALTSSLGQSDFSR